MPFSLGHEEVQKALELANCGRACSKENSDRGGSVLRPTDTFVSDKCLTDEFLLEFERGVFVTCRATRGLHCTVGDDSRIIVKGL